LRDQSLTEVMCGQVLTGKYLLKLRKIMLLGSTQSKPLEMAVENFCETMANIHQLTELHILHFNLQDQ